MNENETSNPKRSTLKAIFSYLLPALAIIIPIVLFMIQVKHKSIAFEIVSKSAIIDSTSLIPEEIEVFFSGKKLKNLSTVNIRIINAGSIPIKREDFEKNMNIHFGEGAEILRAKVSGSSPLNLKPTLTFNEKTAIIKPLLLNPGDFFNVEAFVAGSKLKPTFDTRIVNIKEPKIVLSEAGKLKKEILYGTYSSIFLLLFLFGYLSSSFDNIKESSSTLIPGYDILIFVLASLIVFAMIVPTELGFKFLFLSNTIVFLIGFVYQKWSFFRYTHRTKNFKLE